ncbi:NUDIX hydrolase [Amylibacter sp.]|jgi:8-oxo-dGTP diphosphatase|nr:NUDIX hydrolase [Amylibacter sp.]MDC0550564.1 NUDIX hydrolase [Amylibacter sp.]
MRRYGHPKDITQKYLDRPGSYGIILLDGKILLTHQKNPKPEIQLPGGGIDLGESQTTALHREVLEETGWRISILRRLGAYQRYTYMPEYDFHARKICHIFLARAIHKVGEPTEPGHTAIWSNPRDVINKLASEGDAAFVENFLKIKLKNI